jgi:succinate dehydrogenase / fumarate reductase iron-sulfur subunit
MVQVPLEVYRKSPQDAAPHYDRFQLDVEEHTPVLTVLLRVRDEMDPTLSLRYSCRQAICGSCAMRINGKSRLACRTPVGPEVRLRGRIRIDPMGNQPVLRDLVVDQRPFWDRYYAVRPYLIPDKAHPLPEGRESPMTPEQVEQFRETPRCISCASCYSACPALAADPGFLGPMALAKLYRFVVDPRDGGYTERLQAVQNQGLWLCLRCNLCVEACPKDVRPAERIVDLKWMANQELGAQEAGSRHAIRFASNLTEGGLLNERRLALETLGLAGSLRQLPKAIAMMRKGRSLRRHPPIQGLNEVRAIYQALDRPEDLAHRERPRGGDVKGPRAPGPGKTAPEPPASPPQGGSP